jgi:hypothetical protein
MEVHRVVRFLISSLPRCSRGLESLTTVTALLIGPDLVPHVDELSVVVILVDMHAGALVVDVA